jgi:hypothetical protein
MAKKKRKQRSTQGTPPRPGSASGEHVTPDWRWRSFPVFFALVCGMLLAFFVNEGTANPLAFVLLLAALLGFGFGVSHLIVTNVFVARRVRARREAIARGETRPEDFQDDLVFPDDAG